MVEPAIARRFLRDPEASFAAAGLTEEERDLIRRRDWRGMMHYGVIFFMLEKLGAVSACRTCTSTPRCAANRSRTSRRPATRRRCTPWRARTANLAWDKKGNEAKASDAMIIDCPRPLHDRAQGAGGLAQPPDRRHQRSFCDAQPSELQISDDELRESIETNQLRLMRERGLDLTIFSPRASFMAHHIGDFEVSAWAAICNELCYRVAQLFPDHFIRRPCCRRARASTRRPASPSSRHASSSTASSAST